jgi:two-component system, chemotaxis family, CheB/CheR fusion protein
MRQKSSESAIEHKSSDSEPTALAPSPEAMPALPARGPPRPMPIVAIGASAGGLEAASALLGCLPTTSGMAFILVTHLEPTHESMMADLLGKHTSMMVAEATDGCLLGPDQVFVIPPGCYLAVRGGAIHLSPPLEHHGARMPFDFLLTSLASERSNPPVCIVLSGTGQDGSAGIAALKAAGGYVIAQDPDEAEFDGMPRSAIATGLVDEVLALNDMPGALAKRAPLITAGAPRGREVTPPHSAALSEIISLLKEQTPHDFRHYKPGTLERRIERRLALLGLERGNLPVYLDLLCTSASERDLLAQDLLINVTSFFRDPKVFEMLASTVVPEIIDRLPENQSLRIWAAGCSTGEEVYSLAIICREAINASGRQIKLQIFASDVDSGAIAIARVGLYPADSTSGVTADHLARFFVKDELGYRVVATLRSDVVFTVQDVLADPPFSRVDLVSCRNLLIYLNSEAQAKVISLFHFALNDGGILVLGSAETVGNADNRFKVIAGAERIYRHIARSRLSDSGFPLNLGENLPMPGSAERSTSGARQANLEDICRRAIMASHTPAAILINRKRQCLYAMGPIERYLKIAPGYVTQDVLAMATPALRAKLRLAIDKVSKAAPRFDGGRARLIHDGSAIWFSIDVELVASEHDELLLVCFVEERGGHSAALANGNSAESARNADLEHELEATQAELQAAIKSQEAFSQEQKAINEEALSVNEEFQSTNEELLTSKEELQSLNEELTALNSQLQESLERQRQTSDDLQNVLYSTNVGTLFLDLDLKIRFYTPAVKSFFSIIAGDIGRPLADLRPIAADADLLIDARRVVSNETSIEREISGLGDSWFMRRIFPYRAHDNRIEGVVITFADISERKQIAKALEAAKLEAERANSAKSRFLAAASHDLRQPLQSLTLMQDMLARSVEGKKPQMLLERFEQTLGSMSGMLNTLLDINQIEAGVIEARTIAFPIAEVLDRLRDEFTYLAQSRNLVLKILPSAALVHSDPRLLEQMIRNLLGNAIKYTRRGKILLGCRQRGDTLRVEVWDSGIGIAAKELQAIFAEFHQVDNAAHERTRGLGLGLSIVQRLGNLLGHEIDVRSLPDRGSVFAVTLECAVRPARETADLAPTDDAGKVQPGRQCKIVVVDDDPDVLEMLGQLLTDNYHLVTVASNAESALKLIASGAVQPEILLTDYSLPGGLNGLELISKLRASRPDGLPAIILTGDISSETLAAIAAHDCVQLSKPVKPQELFAAMARLCPPKGLPLPRPPKAVAGSSAARVYVVDDDPEIRAAMREVLENGGRVVRDFASAEAFLASYNSGGEGCLVLDAHMPDMSGVALIDALRARGDHLPVILITGSGDVGLAVAAMRTGACDFIEKPVGRDELLASITRAIDDSRDIRRVDAARKDAAALVAGLTNRQREVMDMVLAGHPSKNIAADLGISQRTVENHRAAIMQRMGAKSLPELARIAQAAAALGNHQSAKS